MGLRNSAIGVELLGHRLAGATELRGEVLELREAVLHRQHRRLVVHVYAWRERKRRDRRGVDVDKSPARVVREHVAAARLAPLAVALLIGAVLADLVLAPDHSDLLRLPERERVD